MSKRVRCSWRYGERFLAEERRPTPITDRATQPCYYNLYVWTWALKCPVDGISVGCCCRHRRYASKSMMTLLRCTQSFSCSVWKRIDGKTFWHKLKRLKLGILFYFFVPSKCVCASILRTLFSRFDGYFFVLAFAQSGDRAELVTVMLYLLTFRFLPRLPLCVAGNLCVAHKILRLFYLCSKDKQS